jgi:hypothetical protein
MKVWMDTEVISDTLILPELDIESRKKAEKIHLMHMSKGRRKQKIEELVWRFLVHLENTRPTLSPDGFWLAGSDITRTYNLHPGYGSLVTSVLRKQRKNDNQKIPFRVLSERPVKVKYHTKPISVFFVKRLGRS